MPAGAASKYNAGDRIKLTQTTVKYFIVTAVADTVLTLYGGTDYTLIDAAISANYYSHSKSPVGFPLSPIKWTVTVTDTTQRIQASPTQNTWYNLGSQAITIPIGIWKVTYKVQCYVNNGATESNMSVTLSTANNSESDVNFTFAERGAYLYGHISAIVSGYITLAAEDIFYLNTSSGDAGAIAIRNENSTKQMIITAVSAYL